MLATTPYAQDTRAGTADKTRWLSIPEVHARLESAGYRNIEKIERESGSYEIKAIDRNGQRVKLYVHSQTGEVMNRRYRDAAAMAGHPDCPATVAGEWMDAR